MSDPYLVIRKVGSEIRTEGVTSYHAGSRSHGLFVEWHWDGQHLSIANDLYGFWPAYYSIFENGVALSTSVPQLMCVSGANELDYAGLAAFLRLGYFLGDRTAIRGIRAFPPSARAESNNGAVEVHGSIPIHTTGNGLARDRAIDGFLALFSQAIRRRLPEGPFAVPLSGGQDSRHILLELLRADHRPDYCITVGQSGTDVPIAAQLVGAAGLQHHVVDQDRYGFRAECLKNHLTNFGTKEHRWMLALTDFLAGRVEFIYDGLGGDVLSAGLFSTEDRIDLFAQQRLAELADDIMPPQRDALLKNLLSADMYQKCNRDLASAELQTELARYMRAPNPVSAFFMANRTRRTVALSPLCLARQVGAVLCPYMDPNVVEFLLTLPPHIFMDHSFHADAIHKRFPQFAHIPFGDKTQDAALRHRERERRRARPLYSSPFARNLLREAYAGRMPRKVRSTFVLPRLVRASIDERYARGARWLLVPLCYLLQLERLCLGNPIVG